MKNYKVKVNGNIIETQKVVVSAFPLNRVWAGEQRSREQTEDAYYVSFDLLEKSEIEIEVSEDFSDFEIRPRSIDFNARRKDRKIFLTVSLANFL